MENNALTIGSLKLPMPGENGSHRFAAIRPEMKLV
jgi:hypothetical protein